ncbi:hypothetical protein PTMSG1_08814 [Pyrenophora teres f. maculata]|nr:hypothetical protein PTMSG1_08814 [Pyrenophora teres f. maculata]
MAPSNLPAKPGGQRSMISKDQIRVKKREKKRTRKAMDNLVALFDSGKIDLATKEDKDEAPQDSSVANLLAEPNVPSNRTRKKKSQARKSPKDEIFKQYKCRVCHVLYPGKEAHPHKNVTATCFDCDMATLVMELRRGKTIFLRSRRRVRFCLVCGHSVRQPRKRKIIRYCDCITGLLLAKSQEEAAEVEKTAAYEICKELDVAKPEELPTYRPEFKLETTPLPGISSETFFIQEKQKAIMQQILEESRSGMNMHREEECAMEI